MPFVENLGVKIYWDEVGAGEPVLLIMGLGWASPMWYRTRPLLAERWRTIAFDNRGVGRSDVPAGPYSIAGMAADAAAVLDAAGVGSAHVVGMSMGGMIAQEFALAYPGRVRSLVLGCTACGGPESVQPDAEVVRVLMSVGGDPEVRARAMNPFIYDAGTPAARIEEDLKVRLDWVPTVEGYTAQYLGIVAWEAYSRISGIAARTLVIHGETDRLLPAANGKLIAGRIAGARLVLVPRASHIFTTDQPEISHREMIGFLDAGSGAA